MELHTNYAFLPLWRTWRILGMEPTLQYRYIYYVYSIFLAIFCLALAPIPLIAYQFIEAKNFRIILANTPVLLGVIGAVGKLVMIWYTKNRLRNINPLLDFVDSRVKNDDEIKCLKMARNFTNLIFWIYFILYTAAYSSYMLPSLFWKKMPLDAWYPFDYHDKYYYYGFTYQVLSMGVLAYLHMTSDVYPLLYILIVQAHMQALQFRIQGIRIPQKSNLEKNHKDLVNCIEDHIIINKIIEEMSAVISKTIFIQFLVSAVIIPNIATSLFIFGSTVPQFIAAIIYLTVMFCQVFPVCYVVTKLIDETDNLRNTIFHSNWIGQSSKFQKNIIIFMQRTQLSNVIMAGHMFPVTLPTLLQIFKFSFSLFAIFSQVSN